MALLNDKVIKQFSNRLANGNTKIYNHEVSNVAHPWAIMDEVRDGCCNIEHKTGLLTRPFR